MTRKLKELPSAPPVIKVLGGEHGVAEMTLVTPKAVNNWKHWNKFPATQCLKMMFELNKLGYTAPPRLWRQHSAIGLRIRRVSK